MTEPHVLTTRHDGVLVVELNRPERLNAQTKSLIRDVGVALDAAAADDSVRCVVLTGAGRGFCAGGDLGDIGDVEKKSDDLDGAIAELQDLHRTSLVMHEMPKPVIAAVNGPCAGAGMAWACAADLRISAESAVFRTSFASAALTGDFGLTWTLPRIVGTAKARELFFLNAKLRAPEALALGLVSEVVPDADFRTRTLDLAQQLAHLSPMAISGIKANLNEADDMTFAELLDAEAVRQTMSAAGPDCIEAAHAFFERREPDFSGRTEPAPLRAGRS